MKSKLHDNLVDCQKQFNRTRFEVGVWWARDGGYGGVESFETLDEAKKAAQSLFANRYGIANNTQIHITRKVYDLVQVIHNGEVIK